jgi:hypothetical protein
MTPVKQTRSLRRAYLEWVDEQIEEYKDLIPRSELLRLADRVVEELRVNQLGQYQITEILLCAAVDRAIFRILDLPSYRSWRAAPPPSAVPPAESPPAPLPLAASI